MRQNEMKVPYAYNKHSWVGFDDPESLREKVSKMTVYARMEERIAGEMVNK